MRRRMIHDIRLIFFKNGIKTDLAKNLIRLSGYTLGVDMEIRYTGLRPGEKLYEELLMKEEGLQDTANKLIHTKHIAKSNSNKIGF